MPRNAKSLYHLYAEYELDSPEVLRENIRVSTHQVAKLTSQKAKADFQSARLSVLADLGLMIMGSIEERDVVVVGLA